MKQISKIQYISQGKNALEHESNIKKVLDKGLLWIQLRCKDMPFEEHIELAHRVKSLCDAHQATLIINDKVDIAIAVDAHGVHLGQKDLNIEQARQLIGPNKLIGATANTLEQVNRVMDQGCDYVGLGPFSFTPTKEKLSPILGLQGYKTILEAVKSNPKAIQPIVAIGGIELEDIPALIATGVYGIALSGLVTKNPQCIHQIKEIL